MRGGRRARKAWTRRRRRRRKRRRRRRNVEKRRAERENSQTSIQQTKLNPLQNGRKQPSKRRLLPIVSTTAQQPRTTPPSHPSSQNTNECSGTQASPTHPPRRRSRVPPKPHDAPSQAPLERRARPPRRQHHPVKRCQATIAPPTISRKTAAATLTPGSTPSTPKHPPHHARYKPPAAAVAARREGDVEVRMPFHPAPRQMSRQVSRQVLLQITLHSAPQEAGTMPDAACRSPAEQGGAQRLELGTVTVMVTAIGTHRLPMPAQNGRSRLLDGAARYVLVAVVEEGVRRRYRQWKYFMMGMIDVTATMNMTGMMRLTDTTGTSNTTEKASARKHRQGTRDI